MSTRATERVRPPAQYVAAVALRIGTTLRAGPFRMRLSPRGAVPALCTLWLARRSVAAPNHKLATLARRAGLPMPDAHAALGDVRAVAALRPGLLANHQGV